MKERKTMNMVGLPTFRLGITGVVIDLKTTPVTIAHGSVYNTGGATAYLQIFNKLAANVVLGTTPPDWVSPCSPGDTDAVAFGSLYMSVALSVAATTTPTGAIAATVNLSLAIA
jgi:hypothetical protein